MVIDILVGVVLLISALISFLRGFIREVLTIFGTVGALAAAYYSGPVLEPLIRSWLGVVEGQPAPELFDVVPYTIIAQVLAYGGVFLLILIVLSITSHILAEAVRKIGLGSVDRTLGVLFGLARGFIILSLVYIPLKLFAGQERITHWFESSKTHMYIDMGANWLTKFLPENTFSAEALGTSGSDTKAKLEQMKLLNPETAQKIEEALKGGLKPEDILKSLPQGTAEPGKGYTEEFRKQMDALFKDKGKNIAPAVPVPPAPAAVPASPGPETPLSPQPAIEAPAPAHDDTQH